MNEIGAIRGLLVATYEGPEAWHGKPLRTILADIDAATAAARPVAAAESIQTLVGHITYWRRRVVAALEAATLQPEAAPEENFPPSGAADGEAWARALAELDASQADLLRCLDSLPAERLRERVEPGGYSHHVLLHGLIHHDLYHAGQIALLAKVAVG